MEISTETKKEENLDILKFINRGQTTINELIFLTQYEISGLTKKLRCITNEVNNHMISIRNLDYGITNAIIDRDGMISNFNFRAKDKMGILNEINLLKYIDAQIPNEIKGVKEVDPNFIYLIKFVEVEKIQVDESDVEKIQDQDGLVIMENEDYFSLVYDEKDTKEKYWTEDIYKAIFYLKSLGFYLGLNDPDPEVNTEILKDLADEDILILLRERNIELDKNVVNMGIIQRIKIPTNLRNLIKKKYVKKYNNFNKPKNLSVVYKAQEQVELAVDDIPANFDKIKVPRR